MCARVCYDRHMAHEQTYPSDGGWEWEGPAVGLLDLDAFFASVEQLDHPEWRGKPVIVGGSAERRGVVSTASYEARPYGVHSGMSSAAARKLCPDAIWTQGHFDRYHEVSAQVMDLIVAETPKVEQVSIDEAFFDVTPGRFSRENPIDICKRLQARVAELGVTCSIGLGVNKTVAKIASERKKPRGLTVVLPGSERDFLAPLPVGTMSGIGGATERHLAKLNIHTLGELAEADPELMEREFGVVGPRMVERAAGLERSPVADANEHEEVKSVSNERTFAEDLTNEDDVRAAVLLVAAITGRRLRKKGLKGTTLTLKLRFSDLHSRTVQCQLDTPTDDERVFGPIAESMVGELWRPGARVRLVGVAMAGFTDERPEQLSLFDDEDGSSHTNTADIAQVSDAVKERFGDDALALGRDLRFRGRDSDTAPMNKGDY